MQAVQAAAQAAQAVQAAAQAAQAAQAAKQAAAQAAQAAQAAKQAAVQAVQTVQAAVQTSRLPLCSRVGGRSHGGKGKSHGAVCCSGEPSCPLPWRESRRICCWRAREYSPGSERGACEGGVKGRGGGGGVQSMRRWGWA